MVESLEQLKARVTSYLDTHLANDVDQSTLAASMQYSVLAGGEATPANADAGNRRDFRRRVNRRRCSGRYGIGIAPYLFADS